MNRNPCMGWADGDLVSHVLNDGRVIADGRVIVRRNRNGRFYLKIILKTAGTGLGKFGDWVWPEGWVWGRGTYSSRCFECCQVFRTNDPDEATQEHCPPCQRREVKERREAGTAIRNHLAYAIGSRDPQPQRGPQSAQELAEIAAQKERDRDESPFG